MGIIYQHAVLEFGVKLWPYHHWEGVWSFQRGNRVFYIHNCMDMRRLETSEGGEEEETGKNEAAQDCVKSQIIWTGYLVNTGLRGILPIQSHLKG